MSAENVTTDQTREVQVDSSAPAPTIAGAVTANVGVTVDAAVTTPAGGATTTPGAPSPAAAAFDPKELPADYEIISELGQGGMGVVFKARQKSLGRVVAMKMILGYAGGSAVERFLLEARSAAALNHPGIVPVFETGAVNGKPYFTMAFIEGGSLSGRLKSQGPLAPLAAAQLLRQIALAVDYAHANQIIHRDLKPDNILIDTQGNPRITDFGLAKRLDSGANLTNTGAVIGTPSYMAPEQARGESKLAGPSVDIYALGGILYASLTGKPPFSGESMIDIILKVASEPPPPLRDSNPTVPPELEAICMKCLAKDPAQRYPTAAAMVADLDAWIGSGNAPTAITSRSAVSPAPSSLERTAIASTNVAAPPSVSAGGSQNMKVLVMATCVLVLAGALGVILFLPKNNPPSLAPNGPPVVKGGPATTLSTEPVVRVSAGQMEELLNAKKTNDFGIEVTMVGGKDNDKGERVVTVGEKLKFEIKAKKKAHVSIWSIDAEGTVTLLLPNDDDQETLVDPEKPLTVPGMGRKYSFTVTPSTGEERVWVLAQADPLKVPEGEQADIYKVFKGAQLDKLTKSLRGIAITKNDSKPVSQKLLNYRVKE